MTNKEPLFPYNNLFITARPGMGGTTLAISIVNKYLDLGKRCLVFENTSGAYYLERLRALREKKERPICRPRIDKYGNLTVIYNYFFDSECILSKVIEHSCDLVVYEAP
ncbi:MAG: hypothetical protein J6K44_02870, partial [Clostridia bacterium]|nr:hypothetical protein [Clostridia bacterium]